LFFRLPNRDSGELGSDHHAQPLVHLVSRKAEDIGNFHHAHPGCAQ
jgi:hypothetical protein